MTPSRTTRKPMNRITFMSTLVTLLAIVGCGEWQPSGEKPGKETLVDPGALDVVDNGPCRPDLDPLPPSGEGMWPWDGLGDLDEDALKKRGLKIPLEDLWTPGVGGLARAAVGLRGCSASFVSADGLMITNHHCAFTGIQRNSTPENNLLDTGFLAGDRAGELDGHGLRAFVFMKQTEITEQILRDMPKGGSDLDRIELIEAREKAAVKECEKKPNTRCRVSRNNDGLEFILLENLELKDVRLVALPPQSLGEFGGEVDNWQWPRHTMDFTFVRAYVDTDGKPAEYSVDNVPYKPEAHFEIGNGGVSPGDLVMVVGTPYRTARYRTLASVRRDLEWYYPTRVNLFSEWTGVMEKVCGLPTGGHGCVTPQWREKRMKRYFDGGTKFDEWKSDPFLGLAMYVQLQQRFGWEPFSKVFVEYRELPDDRRPKTDDDRRDQWLVRFSKQVGHNLGPFFQAWGVPTSEKARASIADLPEWMPKGLPAKED